MVDFLQGSESFAGITFSGCFNIDLEDFRILYNHYKETGENLLDDYTTVIHLGWCLDDRERFMDNDELNKKLQSISNIRKLQLFRSEYIHSLQNYCRACYKRLQEYRENKVSKERRDACYYTSRKDVKEWVSTIHGEECLNCRSSDDLTIDHIKPIARGGENKLSNLQPLCKSCNSAKGTQIIDYREDGS